MRACVYIRKKIKERTVKLERDKEGERKLKTNIFIQRKIKSKKQNSL